MLEVIDIVQWQDILGVLKTQGKDKLDLDYLNTWAKDLEIDGLLRRATDEAGFA